MVTYFPNNPGKEEVKLSDYYPSFKNLKRLKVGYWGTKG